MRLLFVVPLLGFMSFSLAAFIPQSVDTSKRGMVYGHFESANPVERVELAPLAGLRRPSAQVLPTGDFYFADIEPGQYVVTRFQSGGEWFDVSSDRGIREFVVAVEPGLINFIGSWRIEGEKGGTPTPRAFTISSSDKPAADQLLRRLRYSLRGTGWEKQIQ